MKFYNYIPTWLFSTLVVVAIIWLTLARDPLPSGAFPTFEGFDKVGHACMFGGLYFALAFDLSLKRYRDGCKEESRIGIAACALMAGFCVVFGGVVELLQDVMKEGRSSELLDLVADVAGVLVSVSVTPWVLRRIGFAG